MFRENISLQDQQEYIQNKLNKLLNRGGIIDISNDEKWKNDIFASCKILRREEAEIVLKLDKARDEYIQTFSKCEALKIEIENNKLHIDDMLTKLKSIKSEELHKLRTLLEIKESELHNLEFQSKEFNQKKQEKRI